MHFVVIIHMLCSLMHASTAGFFPLSISSWVPAVLAVARSTLLARALHFPLYCQKVTMKRESLHRVLGYTHWVPW